jgi:YHS domain-containing protein
MQRLKVAMVALVMAALAAGPMAAAAAAQGKPQTVCPVLGGNVDKAVYLDYQGKRIYFCCKGCDAEFKKDPEKFIKKLEAQGVTLEKCPTAK